MLKDVPEVKVSIHLQINTVVVIVDRLRDEVDDLLEDLRAAWIVHLLAIADQCQYRREVLALREGRSTFLKNQLAKLVDCLVVVVVKTKLLEVFHVQALVDERCLHINVKLE